MFSSNSIPDVNFDLSDFSRLTQAQITEYFDKSAQIQKEKDIRKITNKSHIIREKYPYWINLNMNKNEIPDFMVSIFVSHSISTEEKDKFVETFARPFFDSPVFKQEVFGKYIVFIDGILLDKPIYSFTEIEHIYGVKRLIPIGDLPVLQ